MRGVSGRQKETGSSIFFLAAISALLLVRLWLLAVSNTGVWPA